MLSCKETAALIKNWDKVLVLCHASPDGDALGSASGLIRGLRAMGKQAEFRCADPVAPKFQYLFRGLPFAESAWEDPSYHVMTVDVADVTLLGSLRETYQGKIELAIDHHGTHRAFTENRWVEPDSAATAEMIWLLLKELGVKADPAIADCVYTGITTDTGCLRYQNATARTYRIAAETLDAGAKAADINRLMWESKTRAQLEAERIVMNGLEFFCGGRCAMIRVPQAIYGQTGAVESDLEGLAALPRQIEGVVLGVTVKEKADGAIKISVRANPPANAAELCGKFGGGGHTGAAGCTFDGLSMEEASEKMKAACVEYLEQL